MEASCEPEGALLWRGQSRMALVQLPDGRIPEDRLEALAKRIRLEKEEGR